MKGDAHVKQQGREAAEQRPHPLAAPLRRAAANGRPIRLPGSITLARGER